MATPDAVAPPQAQQPRPPSRYQQNLRKYGNPLPLRLLDAPNDGKPVQPSYLHAITPSFLQHRRIDVPQCVGTFDPLTRSVWVTRREDMDILFSRGFFGKGTLSRSEATWRDRRVDLVKGGDSALAEQIRAKRRQERKQFKMDRATAMLDAAKAAEAVLTQGQTPSEAVAEDDGVDVSKLNAQTFLVRPTRPDANRNRGRKPKRRVPGAPSAPKPAPLPVEEEESEEEFEEDLVQEMEHLQLGLEEAWFLAAGLGVLRVMDPATQTYPPLSSLLSLFITPTATPTLQVDDPFLVSYIAYHHFRSLGWVVKPGIKFCCDWLLYKRGPVFSHSAFSIAIIPVYSDPADKETSAYGSTHWYEERQSWKWINTVMRVNSLVQKTVILVYVTIPSRASIPARLKLSDGSIDPVKVDTRTLLKMYSIREVSLTRFSAARRRD